MNISQINGNPIYDVDAHKQLLNKIDYMLQDFTTPLSANDVGDTTITEFEVEGNSEQDGTPTPTAPIDIENTGDTLKLISCGKNLIPYPYSETTKTVNGITFTDNGDGTITANGTATADASFWLSPQLFVPSGCIISGCPSADKQYEVQLWSYTDHISTVGNASDKSISTIPFTATTCRCVIRAGITVSNLVFKPQLELGTTATSYEPYSGNTYTIPLTDTAGVTHTMRMFDSVKKHDDGKWYFECKSNLVSFDGTENWGISSIGSTNGTLSRFYFVLGDKKLDTDTTNIQLLSNYLLSTSYKDYTETSTKSSSAIIANIRNDAIFVKISTSIIGEDSVSAFKSQLASWNTAGDPLTVLYQTATTTSYELNASAQTLLNSIIVQSPNANIYFTNEILPTMTGKYRLDAKRYIDNKFAELQAAITALGNS